MAGEAGENQRVTNVTLALKIDALTKTVEAHTAQDTRLWEQVDTRLKTLEQSAAVRETRLASVEKCLDEHDQAIEGLKSSDRKWGGLSVAFAAVITALGAIFKP